MKMSTKGRYGLRVMVELALNYGRGPMLTEAIAKNQQISDNYIHLLVKKLKESGFIKAARGRNGGYYIARDPNLINVLEVVHAMEGKISVVECTDNKSFCERDDCCVARELWMDLRNLIEEALQKVTIGDLSRRQSALLTGQDGCANNLKEQNHRGTIQ